MKNFSVPFLIVLSFLGVSAIVTTPIAVLVLQPPSPVKEDAFNIVIHHPDSLRVLRTNKGLYLYKRR